MFVTVTLNPSLDRTLHIPALDRGEVIRAAGTRVDPGGKGVNVARTLTAAGSPALAVLPVGGPAGAEVVSLLTEAQIPHVGVPIAGDTRMNISLIEPDGTTTKINEPGPSLDDAELTALFDAVRHHAGAGRWVILAGALSPGLDTVVVSAMAEQARAAGARFALDASGAALQTCRSAPPDLVKPNREELSELMGRPLSTLDDVEDACAELLDDGIGSVLCSLGGEGALLVSRAGRWHAYDPTATVRSTVGAGDALLAGFLHAGASGAESLRMAVAWATATVAQPGTAVPPLASVRPDSVRLRRLAAT